MEGKILVLLIYIKKRFRFRYDGCDVGDARQDRLKISIIKFLAEI